MGIKVEVQPIMTTRLHILIADAVVVGDGQGAKYFSVDHILHISLLVGSAHVVNDTLN